MMTNQLMLRDEMSLGDIGNVLYKSGFFSDAKDASQAIVKVLAGREMGFGPIASMTGVNVIQGKIALSANLIAAAIKRTDKYDFRVIEHNDAICEIAFFEGGKEVGRSKFTIQDAKKAGLATGTNWQKYPRNMTFARALSNGAKWYCADVFGGPIYTPDELGANVDAEGEIIDVIATEPKIQEIPKSQSKPAPKVPSTNGRKRPFEPEKVKALFADAVDDYMEKGWTPKDGDLGAVIHNLEMCFAGDPNSTINRHAVTNYLIGKPSSKDWTDAEIIAFKKYLNAKPDSGGEFHTDPNTVQEVIQINMEALKAEGQQELIPAE